jgi:uncharacterized protein
MDIKDRGAWLNHIVKYIGEYTGTNPAYSPQALAENLMRKFFISYEDAAKLASMVGKKTASKLGLAAIELNLTFNCNLTCAYCFIHEKDPGERMTLATAKKAVDFLVERAAFPVVNITLIGGEPLLEFTLIKQIVPYALEAARKRNLLVTWSVTTNGTLLNEEIMQYFALYKINILLSMDGGARTHNRYRRDRSGQGTWHKIAKKIPLIKLYQPWLGVRMTVSTEAISTMRDDFRQLVDLGINQFIIAPAQGARCWEKEQIKQYGLQLVDILRDYHDLKGHGTPLFIEEFEKDQREVPGWGCRAGSTSLAVAPNGDVSPCSKMLCLAREEGKYIVGNVNTGVDLNRLEPFLNPSNKQPQHCIHCARKCNGGCYAVNYEQTGDHFTASGENCLFWVVCQETKHMSNMLKRQCFSGIL